MIGELRVPPEVPAAGHWLYPPKQEEDDEDYSKKNKKKRFKSDFIIDEAEVTISC